MPTLTLIAVGKLKSGPYRDAFDDYAKRMTTWRLVVRELDVRDHGNAQASAEHTAILSALDPSAPVIVLDERGKTMDSMGFSKWIAQHFEHGATHVQCVIGGADGLNDAIRARAQAIVSFGAMTWPHMLARVMAVEQFYRAQQIHIGHPYHRAS